MGNNKKKKKKKKIQNKHNNKNIRTQINNNNQKVINNDNLKNVNVEYNEFSNVNQKQDEQIDNNTNKQITKTDNEKKYLFALLVILVIATIGINCLYKYNTTNKLNNTDTIKEDTKDKEDNNTINTNKKYKIILLGDSLFYQYRVDEYLSYYNYDIINSSTDGITALQVSNELQQRVFDYEPDKVFILLGTNDLHFDYSALETFEHLKSIMDQIRENGKIQVYVLSLLPLNTTDNDKIEEAIYSHRSNEKIDEVNAYLIDYCHNNNVEYINIHDKLIDDEKQFKLDYTREGLHLNDLGYYHLTMKLLEYFEK